MNKQCPGCHGTNPGTIKATVFASNGSQVTLNLCPGHDTELFKIGQLRFTLKYNISLRKDLMTEMFEGQDADLFADIP